MDVKQNLRNIESEIQSHFKIVKRYLANVIAVTKYVTIDRAKEAYDVGLRHFGENRLEGF